MGLRRDLCTRTLVCKESFDLSMGRRRCKRILSALCFSMLVFLLGVLLLFGMNQNQWFEYSDFLGMTWIWNVPGLLGIVSTILNEWNQILEKQRSVYSFFFYSIFCNFPLFGSSLKTLLESLGILYTWELLLVEFYSDFDLVVSFLIVWAFDVLFRFVIQMRYRYVNGHRQLSRGVG